MTNFKLCTYCTDQNNKDKCAFCKTHFGNFNFNSQLCSNCAHWDKGSKYCNELHLYRDGTNYCGDWKKCGESAN